MAAEQEGRSLAETPTWSVATVTTLMVAACFLVERSLSPFAKVAESCLHGAFFSPHYCFAAVRLADPHRLLFAPHRSGCARPSGRPCSPRSRRSAKVTHARSLPRRLSLLRPHLLYRPFRNLIWTRLLLC